MAFFSGVAGGLDEVIFRDAAANASATRRLRANAANLTWHDGTAAGRIFYAGGTDVPVADGGTGLSTGTSGGVLGYTAAGTLASSVALTANAIVLGGGAGATPTVLGSLGTTTTVLHGAAAGAPTFAAVALASDVSGTLPVANGGTGITTGTSGGVLGYTAAGTLASSALLTANGVVLGAGAGATPTATAAGTANQAFRVPGAGGAPGFGTIDLAQSAAVTGTLARANGGTGSAASTTDGQLLIGNTATGNWSVAALTQGSNVTITNGNGTITIAAAAGVSAATQAEMEAATSTTVYASPGRVHFHPGVAKCWVAHNVAAGVAVSYNLDSVTDTGVGNWTENITTDFSNTNYVVSIAMGGLGGSGAAMIGTFTSKAAGSVVIRATNDAGTAADPDDVNVAMFGDHL